ncbi:MAG: glycoside hydrolase family 3 N-terminal domain-containing protein [Eubacteriales bacterium]|nr:glycoside hydrolase family 3 N-terminal domain-containing protein [Eubacteriales bacterium]
MKQYFGLRPGTITRQEQAHTNIVREIAARGMVLLEHDGITLPLKKGTKAALYGYGARNTIFCGLGAASFTSREEISIEEGLERAGISITSKKYLERYDALIKKEEEAYYRTMRAAAKHSLLDGVLKMYKEPYVPMAQPLLTAQDIREAAEAETAIFVISRVSGEDADRSLTEGDYYLSACEKENLRILSENFRKVIVLLNVGAPMDTAFLRSLPNLAALLFVGQAAGVTGLSAADVLTGKVVPEGKLADTWAQNYEDYPNAENFAALNGNLDEEYYSEGIYVGYRYFDSFGIRPAYPFGYGLSYTEFSVRATQFSKENGKLLVGAAVTNTGKCYSGREVMQVYVSAPDGKLKKAYQELKGFAKTKLLRPGETQEVFVEIELRNLACYSEEQAAWILEAGDYLVRVGNSSRNTKIAGILRAEEELCAEQCRNLCRIDVEMKEFSPCGGERREESAEKVISVTQEDIPCISHSYRRTQEQKCAVSSIQEEIPCISHSYRQTQEQKRAVSSIQEESGELLRFEEVLEGRVNLDAFVNSLKKEELACLCVGNIGEKEEGAIICMDGANPQADARLPMAPGTCDTTRELYESRGIRNLHLSDGGSGLRLLPQYEVDSDGRLLTDGILSVRGVSRLLEGPVIQDPVHHTVYEQYTTGLPMATLLAQTWETDCWRMCGEIEAKEMQDFHVELWLAPSMNIHRNPLCGRNFEYYSEDPYLTGECAAAVTAALQRFRGVGATLKHFACNNQETNRHGTNVHISERALREIYLKGYEIAVKKARPAAIMSSYNLINGIHSANHEELLTGIAREEWGFDGIVMTDWGTTSQSGSEERKYPAPTCAGCMRAGNDLIMPGSRSDKKALRAAMDKGEVTMEEVRLCARRILKMMIKLERSTL